MTRRLPRLLPLITLTALFGAVSRGVWWLVAAPLTPVPELLHGRHGQLSLEDALVMVLAATILAGWLWCLGTACLLIVEVTFRGTRRPARLGRRSDCCPWPVRAVVLTVLGAGAASTLAVPAFADGLAAPVPQPAAALVGLPIPDRQAVGSAGARPVAVHVVRPGECLWSIAEDRLPPGASTVLVDRSWRRLYAANRGTVGSDPDLIRPGTRLGLPYSQSRKDAR
jgi:hypothetical protein